MRTPGSPLRFLAVVLGGWAMLRVAALMPEAESVELDETAAFVAPASVWVSPPEMAPVAAAQSRPTEVVGSEARAPAMVAPEVLPPVQERTERARHPAGQERLFEMHPGVEAVALPPIPPARRASRWSASMWSAARGGAASVADAGQLGGSQAGVRIRHALDERRRLGLTARLAAPFRGAGADAAVGLDWRPFGQPVAVIVERRIALDDAPGGTAMFVAGGFGPLPLAGGIAAEGYAQAGGVVRDGTELFTDGALRVVGKVGEIGPVSLSGGLGVWGGAQRDLARLDIGPTMGASVPLGERRLRISLDWRQRVAGNAAPGSGPALSIGTDF